MSPASPLKAYGKAARRVKRLNEWKKRLEAHRFKLGLLLAVILAYPAMRIVVFYSCMPGWIEPLSGNWSAPFQPR